MPNRLLELIISTDDQTAQGLDSVSSKFKAFGDGLAKVGKGLTLGVTAPIVGIGAAIGKLAVDAAPLIDIRNAFAGIAEAAGTSASVMLTALRDSSAGMIANRDLMTSFNKAAQLVSVDFAQRLPDAMGALGKVAAATGQDMGFLLDSLVTGIGRLSPMILDNLGIQVSLTEAQEEYALSIGKSVSELTKQEQQAALMNQVLSKLAENTAAMPDITGSAAAMFANFRVTLQNVKDEIGVKLIPVVVPLIERLSELAQTVLPPLIAGIESVVTWFTSLSPQIQTAILAAVGFAAALGPLLIVVGSVVSALGAIIPVVSAVAGVLTFPLIAIIGAVVAAIALLVTAWKNNWGNIQGITEKVVAFIQTLFEAFLSQLKILFDAFSLAFQGDWRGFGEKLRELWDNAWLAITTVVRLAWNTIKTIVANLVSDIVNFFQTTDWRNVGRNIVQGIANGIRSGIQWIKDAAMAAAKAALEAAKGFLGIDSPSRMMQVIGEQMMQGWAIGIDKQISLPAQAVTKASSVVTSQVTNNYNMTVNQAGRVVDTAGMFAEMRAKVS